MMKFFLSFAMLAAALIFNGCAANHVIAEDGSKYEALSQKQIQRLINISRISSKNNLQRRIISPAEYRFILQQEPSVRITYRGDRFGTAVITWQTRERVLEFRYEDDLTSMVIAGCSFSTYTIPEHERGVRPDKSIPGR